MKSRYIFNDNDCIKQNWRNILMMRTWRESKKNTKKIWKNLTIKIATEDNLKIESGCKRLLKLIIKLEEQNDNPGTTLGWKRPLKLIKIVGRTKIERTRDNILNPNNYDCDWPNYIKKLLPKDPYNAPCHKWLRNAPQGFNVEQVTLNYTF